VCFFECDRSHHALCLVRVNGISERDREWRCGCAKRARLKM
jgi:hypothetical protein